MLRRRSRPVRGATHLAACYFSLALSNDAIVGPSRSLAYGQKRDMRLGCEVLLGCPTWMLVTRIVPSPMCPFGALFPRSSQGQPRMSNVIRKLLDTVSGETRTADHADADMQAVLNELAALNGKAIETLEVAAARAQPTPADAVKALLRKQGKDASPGALVPEVTSVERRIEGAA